jgi:uncharacterized protein (DUF427 family)
MTERGRVRVEPTMKRVRVMLGGVVVADTTSALMVWEVPYYPTYYFPAADVATDLLVETGEVASTPSRGDADHYAVRAGSAEGAAYGYRESNIEELGGHYAFVWKTMDHWFEEDEEVFVHARDPYKRVDVMPSSRHVEVFLGGEKVADTRRAHFLFETRLPTRYYIPAEDVRTDLLVPSEKTSACPYKGRASYFSAKIGDQVFEDIVWYYPQPIPECPKIRGLLCFYNEHVDEIRVDGAVVPCPVTPWSKNYNYRDRSTPDTKGPVTRP